MREPTVLKTIGRAITSTITLSAVLVSLYLVSPLVGAFVLNRAIKSGDDATMNALVDWHAVKDSLRGSIMARLNEKALARPPKPGFLAEVKYEVTDVLAPMMVESMLDERVSPSGFTTYMGPHSPKAEAARAAGLDPDTMPSANVLHRIKHAYFLDLTHFEIELADRWDEGKVFRTVLEYSDFLWRLKSVEMVSLGEGA